MFESQHVGNTSRTERAKARLKKLKETSHERSQRAIHATLVAVACLGLAGCVPTRQNPREYHHSDDQFAGVYYFSGERNSCPHSQTGMVNVWMDGEPLQARQAWGARVNGRSKAVASWFYPPNQQLEISYGGKSVEARVTDRGPDRISYPNNIADVTPAIRDELGLSGAWDTVTIRPVGGCANKDPREGEVTQACGRERTVKVGETLTSIAHSEGLEIGYLLSSNRLSNPDRIYAGQVLCIPQVNGKLGSLENLFPSDTIESNKSLNACRQYHTVVSGETLTSIGLRYGVSPGEIANKSGISNPNYVQAGTQVCVR